MNIFNQGVPSIEDSIFIETKNIEQIKLMRELLEKGSAS
jgi:hypothetical protein